MAKEMRDNWQMENPRRPDYIAPEMLHLFPGYSEQIARDRPDFIPDENTAEEKAKGRISPLQEKYGLAAEPGMSEEQLLKLKKKPKGALEFLDPRNER